MHYSFNTVLWYLFHEKKSYGILFHEKKNLVDIMDLMGSSATNHQLEPSKTLAEILLVWFCTIYVQTMQNMYEIVP